MSEDGVFSIEIPIKPAAAEHRMREALLGIHHRLHHYRVNGGAVSTADLKGMIRETQQHIEAVRDVVWPPESDDETSEPLPPMDDNF